MFKNNLRDLYMMAGAAGSVLIPQAMVNTWPSFFATVAPLTSKALPACTDHRRCSDGDLSVLCLELSKLLA